MWPVGGQLAVDGLAQVQIADDGGGVRSKTFSTAASDLLVGHNAGTESIHHDGDRFGNADGEASSTSHFLARPAATTFLATQRAA